MNIKNIFLYILGIGLLLFGNRSFWKEYQEAKANEKKAKAKAHANDDITKRFETQKLEYDSIHKSWKNPNYYFQVVSLGNFNFKTLQKGKTTIETNDVENASDSQ